VIESFMNTPYSTMSTIQQYDFKDDYIDPRNATVAFSSAEIKGELSGICKYLMYRANYELNHSFDCDRCQVAKDMYSVLWGWDSHCSSNFQPISFGDMKILVGMDTMNSFWTTFKLLLESLCRNELLQVFNRPSIRASDSANLVKNFEIFVPSLKRQMGSDMFNALEDFGRLTHSIGNFVLIPKALPPYTKGKATFNMSRAILVDDYFDLSLLMIKSSLNSVFGKNLFLAYSEKTLLNGFYVDETDAEIIPLMRSHNSINALGNCSNSKPATLDDTAEYLNNVNARIISRGKAMIEIAANTKL